MCLPQVLERVRGTSNVDAEFAEMNQIVTAAKKVGGSQSESKHMMILCTDTCPDESIVSRSEIPLQGWASRDLKLLAGNCLLSD